MKNLQYKSLLLFLAFGLPLSAFAFVRPNNPVTTSRMEERLAKYRNYDSQFIDRRCQMNTGAGIDTQAGKEYKSACQASYRGSKEVADKYYEDRKAAEARIQALTSQNGCSSGDSTDQKTCLEKVAVNFDEAAKVKGQLADELLSAHNQAQKWRDQNAEALKKYREDLRKIELAEQQEKARASTLRASHEFHAAAVAENSVKNASTYSNSGISVAARDGAASSISEYKGKFSALTTEQEQSSKTASEFASAAKAEASQLKAQSVSFTEMATQARARAAALPSDISGKAPDNVPVPGDGRTARAQFQAQQAAAADPSAGQKGISGASTTSDSAGYDSSAASTQPASTQTTPTSTPMMSSAAPAAAAMASPSMTGANSSVASSTPYSDPYAGMNTPTNATATDNSYQQQEQVAQKTPASSNFGEVLGTHDPRDKGEENQAVDIGGETKEEGAPEQVAAAGLSGGVEGETSGASAAPGIRGSDGKPLRTGFSAANGGSLRSSRENMDKDAAASGGFTSDLQSGAVSIAGSEMKSAMQSLAEELGATDLDLDLGDLTAEEKSALAPLEGGDGMRNLAPGKNGRRTASAVQGSDGSIQDEQSVALFSRARSAHERALMRGNLILGTKKKL